MQIRPYETSDQEAVIALWERCQLTRPWNNPALDIQRKLNGQPEWFLLAIEEDKIIGSVMVGYDGHRGWINYLAVDPQHRQQGVGSALMTEAERRLLDIGCPKINLQIRADNLEAIAFYEAVGFTRDAVVSYGKRLIPDE